ncbi:MAG TPA: hypothetical protein VF600_14195 [Abditibacteriaceae bacterium]
MSWRPQILGENHRAGVFCIAFSPDGDALLVGTPLGVELWDVQTRSLQRNIASSQFRGAGVFSPDGETLALGHISRVDYSYIWSVNLVDAGTGALRRSFYVGNLQNATISTLAYSPDGNLLACGTHEQGGYNSNSRHRVLVWDVHTGAPLWTIDESGYAIRSLAFSPNGAALAIGSSNGVSDGGRVRIFNTTTGQILLELQGRQPLPLCGGIVNGTPAPLPAFAVPIDTRPNGRGVTFLSDTVLRTQGDSGVILWDIGAGQVLPSPTIVSFFGTTTELTGSPDGTLLAATDTYLVNPASGAKSRVSLWNFKTGHLVRHLDSISGTTNLLSISPDKRVLVTASTHGGRLAGDSVVRLWRLK